jgi:predicted CoA-binding protein
MQPVDHLGHLGDPARAGDDQDDRDSVAEHLDLDDGRLGVPVLGNAEIADLLRSAHRIAVIGASADEQRPSHGVLVGLRAAGYDAVPVNPAVREVAGLTCYPTLAAAVEATGPVDIVDVFRQGPACPDHAREAVAAGARCLWLQLGIVSREAGRIAHEAGLAVVMDRCTLIELQRLRRA